MASIIAALDARRGVELNFGLRTSRGLVTLLVASVLTSLAPPSAGAGPRAATAAAIATGPDAAAQSDAPRTKKPPAKEIKKVDLNNASLAELKTLPSVGDAEAKKIVADRPYISKTDLVTKAGLPEGVYLAVRDQVS